jgi:hypothetical protein
MKLTDEATVPYAARVFNAPHAVVLDIRRLRPRCISERLTQRHLT